MYVYETYGHNSSCTLMLMYCMCVCAYYAGGTLVANYDMSGHTATVRTAACSYLVSKPGRCSSCRKYRDVLCSMLHKSMQCSDTDRSDPSIRTNLRYLSTP